MRLLNAKSARQVAHAVIRDPEEHTSFDANGAVRPEEITETVGRRLRITLPEGVPGVPNA